MISLSHNFFTRPFFARLRALIPSEYMVTIAFIVTLAAFIVMFFTFTSVGLLGEKSRLPESLLAEYFNIEGLIFRSNLIAVRISFKYPILVKVININISAWYRNGVMLVDSIYPKSSLQFIGKISNNEYLFCYQCCERLSSYEGFIPVVNSNVSLTIFNSSNGFVVVRVDMPVENQLDKGLYTCNDFVKSTFLSEKTGLLLLSYTASKILIIYLKSSSSEEYYIVFPQRYGELNLKSSRISVRLSQDNRQYIISLIPSFPKNTSDFEWIKLRYKVHR